MLFSCAKKSSDNVNPCGNCGGTRDEYTVDEKKWVDIYKVKDTIVFTSSTKKSIKAFVRTNSTNYYFYGGCCSHYEIHTQVYLEVLDKQQRISDIFYIMGKNTAINQNAISFGLINEKAATGITPSVSSTAQAGCIRFTEVNKIYCEQTYTLLPFFSILDKSYSNVYKLIVNPNPNIGATFLYVNRDNGILRIDFADGEVWEKAP
ncbi:MAG: hypothetical protein ACOVQA_11280 [Thermoflexibacteraceae bacterium]